MRMISLVTRISVTNKEDMKTFGKYCIVINIVKLSVTVVQMTLLRVLLWLTM